MQKIAAGQFVTASGFRKAYVVGTAREMSLRNNGSAATAEAYHKVVIAQGHDTAWTVNPGSALLGDREAARQMLAKEAEQFAGAAMLADGQLVEIEGETFKVKIMGERYSDPIHFKRA